MEEAVRFRVRGLDDAGTARRAETALYGRAGILEAAADPVSGQVWLRYDPDRLPRSRLAGYLRDAGLEPVGEAEPG